ncbi:hypothetical protein [Thermosyntropha sp.]|uniref:hypothetical protein n=1 Tax=Thermosyntropha sp. TaxID=2740820 RepID=UPI0025F4ACCA|nr:hypothetical protein [Thermosyntropha sp.]MBO8158939.1 hypothetical protein [Thermosyntropha sp.]
MTIIKDAIIWWVKNIRMVCAILAPALVMAVIVKSILSQIFIVEGDNFLGIGAHTIRYFFPVWYVVDVCFALLCMGALLYYLENSPTKDLSYKKIIIAGLYNWPKLIATAIIIGFVVYGLLLLNMAVRNSLLLLIGQVWALFMYFFIPWRYGLILPVVVIEKQGILKSFAISADLSKGKRAQILAVIIGYFVVINALLIGLGLISREFLMPSENLGTILNVTVMTCELLIIWFAFSMLSVVLFFFYKSGKSA